MNLEEFSEQPTLIQERVPWFRPGSGEDSDDPHVMWQRTSEVLGTTMEELRVAEEEMFQQSEELESSRLASGSAIATCSTSRPTATWSPTRTG